MPDEKPKAPEPMVMSEREAQQERARRVARESAEPERERPIDEAPAGGRYIVDGRTVDAEGKEV
jgi:hypothetical protein